MYTENKAAFCPFSLSGAHLFGNFAIIILQGSGISPQILSDAHSPSTFCPLCWSLCSFSFVSQL